MSTILTVLITKMFTFIGVSCGLTLDYNLEFMMNLTVIDLNLTNTELNNNTAVF